MLFALLCFVFHTAAHIPYVQVAILNLLHPSLRSAIVLHDYTTVVQVS